MATQLDKAGFKTEIDVRPWPELYADFERGTVGAHLGVWIYDSPDGGIFFSELAHSPTQDGKRGSSNATRYSNEELDLLIRSASSEFDLRAREVKLMEISRQWRELRIDIPLLWPLDLYGTRKDLDWEARKDEALLIVEMNRGI